MRSIDKKLHEMLDTDEFIKDYYKFIPEEKKISWIQKNSALFRERIENIKRLEKKTAGYFITNN